MSRPSRVPVSVVIPTFGRRAMLPRTLEPLLRDAAAAEIVVVVDGSRDGSIEYLESLARTEPRLRPVFIENTKKGGARQVGLERATGDVVVFLDDDVVVSPGTIGGHARHHVDETGLVVLGYMPIVLEDPNAAETTTRLYAREYERRCDEYELSPEMVLTHLWSGNMSLRREDALRVGLAEPRFTAGYHQDREFGLRCLKAGLRGRFDRTLSAQHYHRRSVAAFLRDARNQGGGRAQISALHRDVLGPVDPGEFTKGLPAPVRGYVAACRRPRLARVSTAALLRLASASSAARCEPIEVGALKLVRRIEQQSGALDVARAAEKG